LPLRRSASRVRYHCRGALSCCGYSNSCTEQQHLLLPLLFCSFHKAGAACCRTVDSSAVDGSWPPLRSKGRRQRVGFRRYNQWLDSFWFLICGSGCGSCSGPGSERYLYYRYRIYQDSRKLQIKGSIFYNLKVIILLVIYDFLTIWQHFFFNGHKIVLVGPGSGRTHINFPPGSVIQN
jgi:hypothetical protein